MTVTSIEEELAGLDGLITPRIGRALYDHARLVDPRQPIVELGSYRGASTCWLAAGRRDAAAPGQSSAPVYAVDAWSTEVNAWSRYIQSASVEEFHRQLTSRQLGQHVTAMQGLTARMAAEYADEPIGLLYIDADHSEEAALADFHAWQPHLADSAVVIFDDYLTRQNPGVEAAVRRLESEGHLTRAALVAERLAVAYAQAPAVTG